MSADAIEATPTPAVLNLAQPRVVVLVDRDRSFTLHCRRVTDSDWTAFFNGTMVSSEYRGRDLIKVMEVEAPQIALAAAVLIDAQGYTVEGGAELKTLPGWQNKIPLAHRRMLGVVLSSARPSVSDQLTIDPSGEVALLDATWGSANNVDGSTAMLKFSGLKHVFATPTEEQYRRYKRDGSRALVVGGSRTGKTVYLGASLTLARLYDELIQSVDGYCIDGVPLDGRESIAREMDMHHKVMAVQEIFEPRSAVQLAGGDEE